MAFSISHDVVKITSEHLAQPWLVEPIVVREGEDELLFIKFMNTDRCLAKALGRSVDPKSAKYMWKNSTFLQHLKTCRNNEVSKLIFEWQMRNDPDADAELEWQEATRVCKIGDRRKAVSELPEVMVVHVGGFPMNMLTSSDCHACPCIELTCSNLDKLRSICEAWEEHDGTDDNLRHKRSRATRIDELFPQYEPDGPVKARFIKGALTFAIQFFDKNSIWREKQMRPRDIGDFDSMQGEYSNCVENLARMYKEQHCPDLLPEEQEGD